MVYHDPPICLYLQNKICFYYVNDPEKRVFTTAIYGTIKCIDYTENDHYNVY